MKRRDFLKIVSVGSISLTLPGSLSVLKGRKQKPNVIVILVDDLGWRDTGFMGSKYYETPNIDKLADQGIVFTDAYSNAPNCAPTRACLLTGQYSPRHGIYTVGTSARGPSRLRRLIPVPNKRILSPKAITIAEVLKQTGYATASIGKWHLGNDPETGPEAQGFDINIGGNRSGHPKSYFSPYKNRNLKDGPKGEYLTDRLTDEAIKFIVANKDNPFFLYLPHYAVHTPLQAKKEIIEKYRKKKGNQVQNNPVYAAMIESVDMSVGRIMNKLDELGLTENTVVFFFSDNGGNGRVTSNEPLRGSKGMLYEGGIRVPMIVRWPGKVKPGTLCDTPVIGTDFYPTILEITGAEPPVNHIIDGESLIPLFLQKRKLKRKAIFWHFPAYLEAYRGMKGAWRTTPAAAIRQGNWKLMEFFEDGKLELYNLKEDIGEKNNLVDKMPEKVKELHSIMLEWRKNINAPVPIQRNPEYKK
ncbi:sulfatase [candidate division KSB1 bacterium]|nr:MAG: sulfatase [candidate division KSB1 bacterium]